ncbi:YybH family protein [Tahibacter amnicola]|uniref:Nuclear transport factor 2 family protein n=1 Tax=Tahibacter amnicola TaxID=2976241 RepID=A0ABY6BLT7_9GAMM|nr:nuclear transport factor 2 family protein [Tahibacter amnicola]UXI70010.1 nuclear transport factor 2 family protein [Tahibacter amnicola]
MNRRIFGLATLALSAALAACRGTPDETRIREAIAAMEAAVEQHQPREFMAYVADDFTGGNGQYDRKAVQDTLRALLLRNEKIVIVLGSIDVQLQGTRATARVDATLTGGEGWLPDRGAVYAFTTGWKRDGSQWRCISANWEQK